MTPWARNIDGHAARGLCLLLAVAVVPENAVAQSIGHIVTQPARDVGLEKTKIPPVLVRASEQPYTMAGAGSCAAIARSIAALTRAVGPDFNGSGAANKRNLYKVAGSAVVNSLVPFRGLVREVSGASAAARRKAAAVAAGVARRGFLRGLQQARGCRA